MIYASEAEPFWAQVPKLGKKTHQQVAGCGSSGGGTGSSGGRGVLGMEVPQDPTLDPPSVLAALDPGPLPVEVPALWLQLPSEVWLRGGGSSDLATYGLRAHRKGSACQLWHMCHRFAITELG